MHKSNESCVMTVTEFKKRLADTKMFGLAYRCGARTRNCLGDVTPMCQLVGKSLQKPFTKLLGNTHFSLETNRGTGGRPSASLG